MSAVLHLDAAWEGSRKVIRDLVLGTPEIESAVIIHDIFGRIRLALRVNETDRSETLNKARKAFEVSGLVPWVSDVTLHGDSENGGGAIWESAWSEAEDVPETKGRLRFLDRHRNHTAWFLPVEKQRSIWAGNEGPPIVTFYSFKGGVGRTTAATAYALSRARRGEQVVVVDLDLDAPGIGILLDADGMGTTASWGVADFLLECGASLPLSDYRHVCSREKLTGSGTIHVFPAAQLDANYLTKLSRVDIESPLSARSHPLGVLLDRIRAEIKPSIIIIDSRAGLGPSAGVLLGGVAHLHVLLSTTNEQSLRGIELVVRHLGFERASRGIEQAECVVAQTLVPDNADVAATATAYFEGRMEDIFRTQYYATERDDDDRLWSLEDLSSSEAPHRPISLGYRGVLAHFRSVEDVAQHLSENSDYARLAERIDTRLAIISGAE
jgi:cellulose biosynthesis protein BcsQ